MKTRRVNKLKCYSFLMSYNRILHRIKNIDVRDINPGCQIFVPPIEKEKGTRYFYLFLDEAIFLTQHPWPMSLMFIIKNI